MGGMATRVLVSMTAGADPTPVVSDLEGLGAATVQPPQAELPDVVIATIDEEQTDPQSWAERAAQLPGVQTAEVDRMRFSL